MVNYAEFVVVIHAKSPNGRAIVNYNYNKKKSIPFFLDPSGSMPVNSNILLVSDVHYCNKQNVKFI